MEAISAETKLLDECDVVVPINKIAEYMSYIKEIERSRLDCEKLRTCR